MVIISHKQTSLAVNLLSQLIQCQSESAARVLEAVSFLGSEVFDEVLALTGRLTGRVSGTECPLQLQI